MDKRQDRIENHSRYRAASLDQITGRLSDIRARQEAKLQSYTQTSEIKNYENAAKYLLDSRQSQRPLRTSPKQIEISPSVIEIGPEHVQPGPKGDPDFKGSVVSR